MSSLSKKAMNSPLAFDMELFREIAAPEFTKFLEISTRGSASDILDNIDQV